jgi:hypothetical protein
MSDQKFIGIFFLAIYACLVLVISVKSDNGHASKSEVLFFEEFSGNMNSWWVEGGERVWIEDGRLYVKAMGDKGPESRACTVWCKRVFPDNIRIDFDAHVVSSSVNVNNINLFFCFSDPAGKSLFFTREERNTATYKFYHQLNGYILTFLNDRKKRAGTYADGSSWGRFRMRRCPGFHLMTEKYAYHCRQGRTYHIAIIKRGSQISYSVDGSVYLEGYDDQPWRSGQIGLRTYKTFLWWDNIRVTELKM